MKFITLVLAFALTACGGGGSDAQDTIAIYGDSLTTGFINGQHLSPSPAERLAEYTGARAVSHAVNSRPAGDNVYTPGPENIVLLRVGYVDALLPTPTPVHAFSASMQRLIDSAAGKRVVIVGVTQPPEQYAASAQVIDAALRDVAARNGLQFIDVWSVGRVSFGDPIHPDRAGSDKLTAFIAKELNK